MSRRKPRHRIHDKAEPMPKGYIENLRRLYGGSAGSPEKNKGESETPFFPR